MYLFHHVFYSIFFFHDSVKPSLYRSSNFLILVSSYHSKKYGLFTCCLHEYLFGQTQHFAELCPLPSIAEHWYLSSSFNPFTAKPSDALHNASEKTFYQITHTIYLLETIHKIVPYRLGKPKTFLD